MKISLSCKMYCCKLMSYYTYWGAIVILNMWEMNFSLNRKTKKCIRITLEEQTMPKWLAIVKFFFFLKSKILFYNIIKMRFSWNLIPICNIFVWLIISNNVICNKAQISRKYNLGVIQISGVFPSHKTNTTTLMKFC